MILTKFQVIWPFGSEGEGENRLSRWPPSWISDRNNLSHVLFYQSPLCFLSRIEPIGLSIHQKWEIDFQDGHHGRYLGFPIRKILFIYLFIYLFYLQVTPMLPTKFRQLAFWFGRRNEKQIFKMRPFCISDRNYFSHFWSTSHPDASYQVSSLLAFCSGEEAKNRFSRWLPLPPSWIWTILAIFYLRHPDVSYQVSKQSAFQFKKRSTNRFSRWPPWSWISNQNDFSYFWSTSHPDASYISSRLAFGSGEDAKNIVTI